MPHNNIVGNLGQTLAADRPIGGPGPWSGICAQAPHTCPRRAASIVEAVPTSYLYIYVLALAVVFTTRVPDL